MFDETPKVGDKVKVVGKIKDINEDTGEVEVSYDDVSILGKSGKETTKDNSYNNEPSMDETPPEDQSLDSALSRAFPNTQ